MIGIDQATGRVLSGVAHLRQSIARILSTPLGSRVARRDFGSRLFDLVDAPMNPATRVLLYAATATALTRWEPRIRVQRVQLSNVDPLNGQFAINVIATNLESGDSFATTVTLPGVTA